MYVSWSKLLSVFNNRRTRDESLKHIFLKGEGTAKGEGKEDKSKFRKVRRAV